MKKFYRIEYQGAPRHVIEEAGTWRLLEGDLFGSHRAGAEIARDGHRLLAPVEPSKIVCIGLNYKDHAAEQNKPLPAAPLDVHQAVDGRRRPRRARSCCPRVRGASTTRPKSAS